MFLRSVFVEFKYSLSLKTMIVSISAVSQDHRYLVNETVQCIATTCKSVGLINGQRKRKYGSDDKVRSGKVKINYQRNGRRV